MTLTEEEAKAKRCQESFGDGNVTPQGHTVAVQATYGGSYAMGTSPSHCIGSGCMAWRWVWIHSDTVNTGKGYCGKAGEP